MTAWHVLVAAWLAYAGLAVVLRGLAGTTRAYGARDALFGALEASALIWIVVTRL